jgi:hypothetical protein
MNAKLRLGLLCGLQQNYPNPFNPATVISCRIGRMSHVIPEVFDLLARRVAVLVDAIRGPEKYAVSWKTEGLSTGPYVYRLSAGGKMLSRRMILLR